MCNERSGKSSVLALLTPDFNRLMPCTTDLSGAPSKERYQPMSSPQRVRCREIVPSDLEGVIAILTQGFEHVRNRYYWEHAIKRLSEHVTPPGLPKYGFLLESAGVPVGILLLIFSSRVVEGTLSLRCNVSSWYVAPSFRSFAPLLAMHATRNADVTYLNITASPHTWPLLEAQGYKRFSNGVYIAVPGLRRSQRDVQIQVATQDSCRAGGLQSFETDLLLAHASYGCVSLVCRSGDRHLPFVFGLQRKYGVPFAHLIYCRDPNDFVECAGSLGRFLGRRGFPLVVLDSDGPIRGLVGKYLALRPKYSKGPRSLPVGDLAYTERVMFGF